MRRMEEDDAIVMNFRHGASGIYSGARTRSENARLDDAAYDNLYPYHAEICALSELKKKPGFGIPLASGMGGHCLLYLNGVRLDRMAGYPTLELCPPEASPGSIGVGISVNSHYKNANWVAAEGRDFLWRGALKPGERLTRETYERTQSQAKAMGLLDGVLFHEHFFRDKPPGMSERDFMYEISVATDYGARFGRDVYRARIPLNHTRMAAIVDYLNSLNVPYRDGHRVFDWRVFNNNCVHVAHNALAETGIWAPSPTGQFVVFAAFRFPVPKNKFVELMLRANDLPLDDAQALYEDKIARRCLFENGTLPTIPAALAVAEPAIEDNDIYDVDRLRLIFFDNPWGPYRRRFIRIFTEPRYQDLRTNLRYFANLYARAQERSGTIRSGVRTGFSAERARFQTLYEHYIVHEAARVKDQLMNLDRGVERLTEQAS